MPADRDQLQDTADPHRDVSGALHDLANALTVLLGWVAEARRPDAVAEEIDRALAVIERRAKSARSLARRAMGAAAEKDCDAPVDEVLRDVIEALSVEATRVGVRLRRVGQFPGYAVLAPGDLAHVLTNIILNAVAHAPPASEVRIVAVAEPIAVVIDVSDDGPGIEVDRRGSIFQGDSTRPGGTGIGLRHARAMAVRMGGNVEIAESERGACFRVRWPRSATSLVPPPTTTRAPLLFGARVLVVEDDRDIVQLLEAVLAARGAFVSVARSADDVFRLAPQGFDAALVDLSPIEGRVSAAIAALRSGAAHVAIVFTTGDPRGPATGLGDEWLRKPFEVADVVEALARAMRKYA